MDKKFAVILSGCGYLDGAEIRESVLTLLALDMEGVSYDIFAPDKEQHHVVDHRTGKEIQETRNILSESARIARGKIQPIDKLNAENYHGLLLPGGFGVAKNLCSFAFKGSQGQVDESILKIIKTFKSTSKPIGAICIAPALVALSVGKDSPELTIGDDQGTASEIEKLGAKHTNCSTTDCIVDTDQKIVTTPAYMDDGANLADVFLGIQKAIKNVISLT